jgi:hypothetical protein
MLGINIDSAESVGCSITNPYHSESFSYETENENFGVSITSNGLTIGEDYIVQTKWYIDNVFKELDLDSFTATSSSQGSSEFYTCNISSLDVGSHDVKTDIKLVIGVTTKATGTDTNTFWRDPAPPTHTPTVSYTTPANDYTSYNYSASGTNYQIAWTISDTDNNIATMNLYLEDVLQTDWTNPNEGSYSNYVTIDTEKVYTIKVNGSDDDSNDYSETTYLVAYNTSAYITVNSPSNYYLGSAPNFNLESGDPDGLNNLSYSVGNYGYWSSNETTVSGSTQTLADTYNYTYANNWSIYVDNYVVSYGVPTGWWNSSWNYRTKYTLTSDTVLSDFEVNVTVKTTDGVYAQDKANGADWRVVNSSGYKISHWVEDYDDTGDSMLWFKGDLVNGDSTFYLYYGNSGASSVENGDNVFVFFDDFESYSIGDIGAQSSWDIDDVDGDVINHPTISGEQVLAIWSNDSENQRVVISHAIGTDDEYFLHYDYYLATDYRNTIYLWDDGNELVRARYQEADGKFVAYHGVAWDAFVPPVSMVTSTWYEMDWELIDSDADLYVDNVEHLGTVYEAFVDGVDDIVLYGYGETADSMVYYDNMFVRKYTTATISFAVGEKATEYYDSGSHTITDTSNKGVGNKDSTFTLDLNSSANICVDITIKLMFNDTVFWVYSSSSAISQTDSFTMNSGAWSSLSDGAFNVNITMFDDSTGVYSQNLSYYKDTTAPTLTIQQPYNSSEWFVSEIPSLDYTVDWGINDGILGNRLRFEINYNNSNGITIVWNLDETIPLRFPACDKKIVESFGSYYFRLTAIDSAGNSNQTSIYYFTVYNERSIAISATSSYDSSAIDVDKFLEFYIDGINYDYTDITVGKDEFEFVVTDSYATVLYSNTLEAYASTKALTLSLRAITITNSYSTLVSFRILKSDTVGIYESAVGIDSSTTVYLVDGEYTFEYKATDEKISETEFYTRTSVLVTTSSTETEVNVGLDRLELPNSGGSVFSDRNIIVIMISGFVLVLVMNTLQKGNVGRKLVNQFRDDKGFTQEEKDSRNIKKIKKSLEKTDEVEEYMRSLDKKDKKNYRKKL